MNSNRHQPTALDPEWVLVANQLKEHLREKQFQLCFEDTGRKVWMMNKNSHSVYGSWGYSWQAAPQLWCSRSEAMEFRKPLLLRDGPKGSGWNGDFQSPPSTGQVCDSTAHTKRELTGVAALPKHRLASPDLGKQRYLLRARGQFPLVPPLPVKANSVNWELTCSVTSDHTGMWDSPANLIPTAKPAKTHTSVSCQTKWEDAKAQYWRQETSFGIPSLTLQHLHAASTHASVLIEHQAWSCSGEAAV